MHVRGVLGLAVLGSALATSFYDNPEQDVLYNKALLKEKGDLDWSREELERRWGGDVRLSFLLSVMCCFAFCVLPFPAGVCLHAWLKMLCATQILLARPPSLVEGSA